MAEHGVYSYTLYMYTTHAPPSAHSHALSSTKVCQHTRHKSQVTAQCQLPAVKLGRCMWARLPLSDRTCFRMWTSRDGPRDGPRDEPRDGPRDRSRDGSRDGSHGVTYTRVLILGAQQARLF